MWLLFKGGFLLNLLRFVRDRSKQFLFNRQSFVSLVHFYMVSIPVFAVRLALSLLCATTFYEFFYKGEFSSILTPYLAAIGASISLASATFSYARAITDKEEEETLISIGEYFLGTTVLLIFALLITWGGFQIQKFLEKISYYETFKALLVGIISFGNIPLLAAGENLHKGLARLAQHLFRKSRL
jgi:hypothetical protein